MTLQGEQGVDVMDMLVIGGCWEKWQSLGRRREDMLGLGTLTGHWDQEAVLGVLREYYIVCA